MGGRHASGPRLIRRYENRKLYDARAREHVTLDGLAAMIAAGEDIHVVERATGQDITQTVLAQVIFESVKQRNVDVPRQVLARLIRFGRRPGSTPPRAPATEPARGARDEAERIVAGLVQRGRLTLEEALTLRQEITESIQRIAGEAQRGLEQRLKGLLESSGDDEAVQPALRRLQERLLDAESWIDTPGGGAGLRTRRKRG